MVYDIQWIMVATDVPEWSARSLTSARSQCSITAAITLSGISPVASLHAETDARLHFVSASESITPKCVPTLPRIRHSSEEWGWKKRKKESEEEENEDEKKLHNHRLLPLGVRIYVCLVTFPMLSANDIVSKIQCLSRNRLRVSSTLELCSVTSLCGASWDTFSGIHAFVQEASIKVCWWFCKDIECTAKLNPTKLFNRNEETFNKLIF